MSFEACAQIVEKGDPQRFLAAMAAPVAARRVLFPLYAFNVQVARAPWVTEEPMIAEMRLQWWRDALEEIAEGREVRKHEVTTQLASILDADGAKALDRLVAARRWDIYKDPFEDERHFEEYLGATAGELAWQAARALGAMEISHQAVYRRASATGFVRFMAAVTALEDKGRVPLVDGRESAIRDLVEDRLIDLGLNDIGVTLIKGNARAAMLEGWETEPLLRKIEKDPSCVARGEVSLSPFRSRMRLLHWSMTKS